MKNIIKVVVTIFLCFLAETSFAQHEGIAVAYKEIFNTDNPVEMNAILYVISSSSIYKEDLSSRKELNEPTAPPEGVITIESSPLVSENKICTIDFESNIVKTFGWIVANQKLQTRLS